MSRLPHAKRLAELLLLLLVGGSILWRGGKSVDATWILGSMSLMVIFSAILSPLARAVGITKRESSAHSLTVPFGIWGLLLFFLLWSGVSYITSSTRTYGLDELVRDTSCVLLFFWIVRHAGNHRTNSLADGFFRVIAFASALAVMFGLAVYIVQPVNRFTGTFLDWRFHTDYWPNAWAQYVLLAWPIVALLAMRVTTTIQRSLYTAIVGLLLGSLLLSFSRGALIAFAGQLVCLSLCIFFLIVRDARVFKSVREQWKRVFFMIGAITLVALSLFYGANALRSERYDVQSVSDKIAFRAAEGTSSIDERSQFWQQALALSFERPLTGYGPYSFRFAQPHLMADVFATSDHPHNLFLKLAAERGWPAAISLFTFFIVLIVISFWYLLTNRMNDWTIGNDAQTIALLLAVLGVLAHNLIDYNLQFVGIAVSLWMILALLSLQFAHVRPISRASYVHWRISRIFFRVERVMIALLLLVVLWEGSFLVISSVGRHAEAAGDVRTALNWYERSSHEWFSRDLLLARATLLGQQGLLDASDEVLALSLQENSVDARAWRLRAELSLRRNEPAIALRYSTHAYELGRYTDLGILRVLIEAALASGEKEQLIVRKIEFDALFSAYARAIVQNTHFIALGGTPEELQRIAGHLGRLFPNDAERYIDIAADAFAHAEVERTSFRARPAGLLW